MTETSFFKTDIGKMIIFMFLGLLFAIFVLGYHKSPSPNPSIKKQQYNPKDAHHDESNVALSKQTAPSITTNEFDKSIF